MANEFFIVYKAGNRVYSKKGTTGAAVFDAPTYETVLADIWNNQLDPGRSSKQRVIVVGDYSQASAITVPNFVTLECEGIWTSQGFSGSMLSALSATPLQIEIIGADFDVGLVTNNGMHFDGVDGFIVRRARLQNANNHGLTFDDCDDFLISEVYGWNNGDDVVTCHGSCLNGTIEKVTGGGGRNLTGASALVEIEGEAATGVDNASPSLLTVRGCRGKGGTNGTDEFDVPDGSAGDKGIQVTIDNQGGAEFMQHGIVLDDNIMEDFGEHGILVQAAGAAVAPRLIERISVTNNRCNRNGQYGIGVLGSKNVTVANNHLAANVGNGLHAGNSDSCIFAHNHSIGNAQGFEMASTCNNLEVTGNILRGNTTRQAKLAGNGVDFLNNTLDGAVGLQTLDLQNGNIDNVKFYNVTGNSVVMSGTKYDSTRYRNLRYMDGSPSTLNTEFTETVAGATGFPTDTGLANLATLRTNAGNKLVVTPESNPVGLVWDWSVSGSTVTITHNQAVDFNFIIEASTENQAA